MVTLLVSPDDGERIALAASEGQIMLTLRNPLDTAPDRDVGYADRRAARTAGRAPRRRRRAPPRASAPAKPVQPEPAAAPAPKIYTVEAIRGAKRSEEIVR